MVAEPLHRLFDGHMEVARHRNPERVVRALVGYLSRFAAPDPDVLRLRALAVRGGLGAVLLPAAWRRRVVELERHLGRAGLWVIDAPHAWLDVRNGDVLAPRVVDVDAAALDDLHKVAAGAGRAEDALPAEGTSPLRGWVLPADAGDGVPSRAEALVSAMRLAYNLDVVGGGRALPALADRLRAITPVTAPPQVADADAAALVADLLAGRQ